MVFGKIGARCCDPPFETAVRRILFDLEIPDEEAEKFRLVGDLVKYVDDNIEN